MKKQQHQTQFKMVVFLSALAMMAALFYSAASVYADRIALPHERGIPPVLSPLLIKNARTGNVAEFQVELALDQETQRTGLMYRTEMPEKQGMLFLFQKDRTLTMWMKNTLIPLDMIFINAEGVVIDVHENAVPHSLEIVGAKIPGRGVLELNAGMIKKFNIAIGDQLHHGLFGNLPHEEVAQP